MYLNNLTMTKSADGDAEIRTARETTIVQYLSLVRALAKGLQARVPSCVTFDDLVSAGTIGLIQAVDRFQPSRRLQFGTYAKHRVWGAMLDFLRGEDPLSRAARRQARTATEELLPTTLSLEEFPAYEPVAITDCSASRFADRVDLARARQCLSARERRVISLLYDLDWQNRDVARELGVNESRVSQIKHAALFKIRAGLLGHPKSKRGIQ